MAGYTQFRKPDKSARAIGKELMISPKHSVEICRILKGMDLEKAKELLEEVAELKRAVPFKRYKKQVCHQKGKIGPARFPRKAAREILKVLESAENNAEYKGLMPDNMYIEHIAAHRGRVYRAYMPRAHGASTPHNRLTTNIEVILMEKEE